MKDFTLKTYRELLITLQKSEYNFLTFEEYCKHKPLSDKPFVILRHDVDLQPQNSLATAQIEHELNIRATYYFRIVPESNQPEYIKAIAALGHEIGYHYEDLNLAKGNIEQAYENYQKNLAYFRLFYPVKTISMHGSPREKIDNRDIWQNYDYRDFGIIGEPYFDFLNREDILYFTDTGRMWNGDKYNIRDKAINKKEEKTLPKIHSTSDLISWIKTTNNQMPIMINTHPQRWTDNKGEWYRELLLQTLKNQVKALIKK